MSGCLTLCPPCPQSSRARWALYASIGGPSIAKIKKSVRFLTCYCRLSERITKQNQKTVGCRITWDSNNLFIQYM
jgi:hypothetical protein